MIETFSHNLNNLLNIFSAFNFSENVSALTIYISTFVSLFLNGLTNLPSSQIIYLTLGYLINVNNFNFYIAIFLGSLGNTLGNLLLYKIIYNNSDFLNSKFGKFMNIKSETLEKYTHYFRHRWWGWLIVGKLTPSLKVLVPVICGVSRISFSKAVIIFFTGSLVWASIVTYLGFYFGKQASLIQFYIIVTCVYILLGSLGYLKIKYNKSKNISN
jgi:membrane protein DedA with SNARE-associated domain